jgi:predicted ATPase
MICKLTIQNFKRFKDPTEFSLKPEGVTFLAGGNNSGKSTLLHALAVWEFARSVVEVNKGAQALLSGGGGHKIAVRTEDFSPVALPDPKHLWSNLRSIADFTLRLRCDWQTATDPPTDRHLEFGFALKNDSLFLKRAASNLGAGDAVPRMAYLPSFAGMSAREERMTLPSRKKLIGRGLAGAVLRNSLYDSWEQNAEEREKLKGPSGRISQKNLAELRKTDSWEQLMMVLEEVFKTGLTVRQFNDLYHTTLDVSCWDGQLIRKRFKKKIGVREKDLMVEGSGFLQWLSVYALALNKELDVLLLDEPDAHLHPALQGHLIQKLTQLARENQKQVLLATHSTTILSETKADRIFRMENQEYLKDERGRVALFVGLGSQYAPRLDQLKRTKRLFMHDGPSDLDILQTWADTLGLAWPDNLVTWKYTKDRDAREILFSELRAEINTLRGISLQDRDDYPLNQTRPDLTFDNLGLFNGGLGLRRWRRRNIENYLLHPGAIARASGRNEQDVVDFLRDVHGLNVTPDFINTDCPAALALADGKDILTRNARSIKLEFGVGYKEIAQAMTAAEIADDPRELLRQLIELTQ